MNNCNTYKFVCDAIHINLYAELYLKAHYHISDRCTIDINQVDNDKTEIILSSHNMSTEELETQFKYYLSQEKIKDILNKENHKIKELIVEQAFKPISNLKQVLSNEL